MHVLFLKMPFYTPPPLSLSWHSTLTHSLHPLQTQTLPFENGDEYGGGGGGGGREGEEKKAPKNRKYLAHNRGVTDNSDWHNFAHSMSECEMEELC